MPETFNLKIASKRQVTLPVRLLDILRVAEGDVLQIEVHGNEFVGRGMKLEPAIFSPAIMAKLRASSAEMDAGGGVEPAPFEIEEELPTSKSALTAKGKR